MRVNRIMQRHNAFSVQDRRGIELWIFRKLKLCQLDAQAANLIQRGAIVGLNLRRLARIFKRGLQVCDAQLANIERGVPVKGTSTAARSRLSAPCMALSTSAQSSTERHIGPVLSMLQLSAIAP